MGFVLLLFVCSLTTKKCRSISCSCCQSHTEADLGQVLGRGKRNQSAVVSLSRLLSLSGKKTSKCANLTHELIRNSFRRDSHTMFYVKVNVTGTNQREINRYL